MERIEVTRSEQRAVDNARDAMHLAVINILKVRGIDDVTLDLSELGESIALEGSFEA